MGWAGAWPGETATTVGSPLRPHPEPLMPTPPGPAAFRINCVHSLGIACVSRLKADFRGLGGSGAGPPSLRGRKQGGICLQATSGAGAVFMGRGTGYLSGGFGHKPSA